MNLKQLLLFTGLVFILAACMAVSTPSAPTSTPVFLITTRDANDVRVESEYVLVTREQMIEHADTIFTGTVSHISSTTWNQDSGEYWEIEMAEIVPEEEVVVENGEIPDELHTESGVRLSTTLNALPLHQITFTDVRPIVDSVGLDKTVILTVLGNSLVDSTTRATDHTLQVEDEVIVFARQTEIQWWNGNPPQLVEGQQGPYYEVGRKEVLMFANAPDASYLRLGEDGMYHAQYPALEYDQEPASLDELVTKIAQLRPNDVLTAELDNNLPLLTPTAEAAITSAPASTRRPPMPMPTVKATPKITQVIPDPGAPECARPYDLAETKVNVLPGPPFCIVWIDKFDDERGFRVHLSYPRSGERFVYKAGPDVTQLIVPAADAPRLDESWQQCDGRKDFDVLVTATRDIEWQVGGMASITHCPPTLPTATVSPF